MAFLPKITDYAVYFLTSSPAVGLGKVRCLASFVVSRSQHGLAALKAIPARPVRSALRRMVGTGYSEWPPAHIRFIFNG